MKIYLVFENGKRYEICTTPYHVWIEQNSWEGASDLAYLKWQKDQCIHDISDFDLSDEYCWIEVVE